ncbi:MAG: histidine phosphatase family protein [Deltaproteobacteria bacterium]|nr:histidine phosphatase family protein [Deltaproteobacteria bacterium]MDH3382529.1 histidine phosphatase family protein [Deltaproteobacteria bacterium]
MKTIILVRHAKSSWKDSRLKDFDRPLNKRGKRDAPFMGKKLKDRQIMPDLILSSPAKRAKKTATSIAEEIGYPKKKIRYDDKMYHSGARALLEIVRNQDDGHGTIMLFGHNPDFNDLADMLLKQKPGYNIPTTGVFCIRFPVDSWRKVQEGKGETVFFDYPKRHQVDSA